MYSTRPVGSVEVVLTTFDTARHHREELDMVYWMALSSSSPPRQSSCWYEVHRTV